MSFDRINANPAQSRHALLAIAEAFTDAQFTVAAADEETPPPLATTLITAPADETQVTHSIAHSFAQQWSAVKDEKLPYKHFEAQLPAIIQTIAQQPALSAEVFAPLFLNRLASHGGDLLVVGYAKGPSLKRTLAAQWQESLEKYLELTCNEGAAPERNIIALRYFWLLFSSGVNPPLQMKLLEEISGWPESQRGRIDILQAQALIAFEMPIEALSEAEVQHQYELIDKLTPPQDAAIALIIRRRIGCLLTAHPGVLPQLALELLCCVIQWENLMAAPYDQHYKETPQELQALKNVYQCNKEDSNIMLKLARTLNELALNTKARINLSNLRDNSVCKGHFHLLCHILKSAVDNQLVEELDDGQASEWARCEILVLSALNFAFMNQPLHRSSKVKEPSSRLFQQLKADLSEAYNMTFTPQAATLRQPVRRKGRGGKGKPKKSTPPCALYTYLDDKATQDSPLKWLAMVLSFQLSRFPPAHPPKVPTLANGQSFPLRLANWLRPEGGRIGPQLSTILKFILLKGQNTSSYDIKEGILKQDPHRTAQSQTSTDNVLKDLHTLNTTLKFNVHINLLTENLYPMLAILASDEASEENKLAIAMNVYQLARSQDDDICIYLFEFLRITDILEIHNPITAAFLHASIETIFPSPLFPTIRMPSDKAPTFGSIEKARNLLERKELADCLKKIDSADCLISAISTLVRQVGVSGDLEKDRKLVQLCKLNPRLWQEYVELCVKAWEKDPKNTFLDIPLLCDTEMEVAAKPATSTSKYLIGSLARSMLGGRSNSFVASLLIPATLPVIRSCCLGHHAAEHIRAAGPLLADPTTVKELSAQGYPAQLLLSIHKGKRDGIDPMPKDAALINQLEALFPEEYAYIKAILDGNENIGEVLAHQKCLAENAEQSIQGQIDDLNNQLANTQNISLTQSGEADAIERAVATLVQEADQVRLKKLTAATKDMLRKIKELHIRFAKDNPKNIQMKRLTANIQTLEQERKKLTTELEGVKKQIEDDRKHQDAIIARKRERLSALSKRAHAELEEVGAAVKQQERALNRSVKILHDDSKKHKDDVEACFQTAISNIMQGLAECAVEEAFSNACKVARSSIDENIQKIRTSMTSDVRTGADPEKSLQRKLLNEIRQLKKESSNREGELQGVISKQSAQIEQLSQRLSQHRSAAAEAKSAQKKPTPALWESVKKKANYLQLLSQGDEQRSYEKLLEAISSFETNRSTANRIAVLVAAGINHKHTAGDHAQFDCQHENQTVPGTHITAVLKPEGHHKAVKDTLSAVEKVLELKLRSIVYE